MNRSSPHNQVLPLAVFLSFIAPNVADCEDSRPVPEWIWLGREPRENAGVYFRKTFSLPSAIKSGALVATCDNHMVLFINGERVVEHGEWQTPVGETVTGFLRKGENEIVVRARNDGSAAGLLVALAVDLENGETVHVVTDSSWNVVRDGASSWKTIDAAAIRDTRAYSFGPHGVAPWGDLGIDPGELPRPLATAVSAIRALPGFEVDLLYSVPRGRRGSWVSLTPIPGGRLICSAQYGGLVRVTPGRGVEDTVVEDLNLPIGQAQGLLWALDSLYVTVNGNAAEGSGLYRITDSDGDGELDQVRLLKTLRGGGEHGPHGVRLGPDGMIYVIAGNHTDPPADLAPGSPHRNWSEDLLLPRNPDGRGHATGRMAPGGWIARTDPEGKSWEIFCGGFRNPYDMDFNPAGEIFTYDADMEWDTGTPWYRPTRVNHAVSAAEFGWRYGTGKWPEYYADSLGAVVDIGLGSPTGISFGTGARFPTRYRRALFINDWTYGKIYAVHLVPDGASYRATFEIFLSGRPLPVTDIAVLPDDGHLYFTTGGRRTQSGLYRVRYTGDGVVPRVDPAAPGAAAPDEEAGARARSLRRRLESFHGRPDPAALDIAWPHLNSTDRAIRYAARVAVERQDIATWLERAMSEARPRAIIQAMLCVTRAGGSDHQGKVLERLGRLKLGQLAEAELLDALRVYQLAFIRLGGKSETTAGAVRARLDPLFPHPSESVNRELCRLLVYLQSPGVASRAMDRLEAATTQQDQMFYAFVLRTLERGWTLERRKAYFSWLNIAEAKYRGGASFQRFVQQIRRDAVARLSPGDRRALAGVISGEDAVEVVRLETTRQFVHNWQMADLEPLLDRVESGRSFARGRAAYEAAQCVKCHRFREEGGATGPDLTGVGSRFSPLYLLEALIEPSKVVSDQYVNSVILTVRGEAFTGRVIDESEDRLSLRASPFSPDLIEIAREDIVQRRESSVSEMPAGLINVLSQEEILDLIAYLRSAGDPGDAAFRKN